MKLFGGGYNGTEMIQLGEQRDVVLAHFVEHVEDEPFASPFWILDGASGSYWFDMVWDGVLLPDESGAVVGRNRVLENVGETADDRVSHREELKQELGVSDTQLDVAAFEDGFVGDTFVVQPLVVRFPVGDSQEMVVEPLKMAGGGALARRGDEVLAQLRPLYWVTAESGRRGDWLRLDVENRVWTEPSEEGAPEPKVSDVTHDLGTPPSLGTVLVKTRNGRLALVVVGDEWLVQVSRVDEP